MSDPVINMIDVGPRRLRTATWGSSRPRLVLLHDGLGSITQWRDVPARLAERTGLTVVAYERAGHGHSTPIPTGAWPVDWLDHEAAVLSQVLVAIDAEHPVLVGHSDGGTIALLHSAGLPSGQPPIDIAATLALAPHSWVEQVCFDSIAGMRTKRTEIEAGLARHHQHPQELFEAWSAVWVSGGFRDWDIRPRLAAIDVPVVIAQGADDAYASDAQAHETAAAVGANGRSVIVPAVGHIMHHDDPGVVVDLIVDFVAAQY